MSTEDGRGSSSEAHHGLARRDERLLEIYRAHRRLQHLYDMSRLLACFESVERTVPEIMAIFDEALTLDSAVLILDGPDRPRTMMWGAEAEGEQTLLAAKVHAQATYRRLMRSGISLESSSTRTYDFPRRAEEASRVGAQGDRKKSFVLLPLALEGGAVLGALQIEGVHALKEQDLAFMSAVVNELAIAVDRCATKTERSHAHEHGEQRRRSRARLEGLHRSSESMNRLLSDVVDTAAIEACRFAIEPDLVPVAPLVAAAIGASRRLAASKALSLVSEVEAELGPLHADSARLEQVLASLVRNAIELTPPHGTITVRAGTAGDETLFSVAADCPGIPADELPHLFDPRWQAERHARPGSGLDLFIVKGIIEAHGGRIGVESAAGKGTTIFFALSADGAASSEPFRARPHAVRTAIEQRAPWLVEFAQGLDLRKQDIQTALESAGLARELTRRAVDFRRDLMVVVSDALRAPQAPPGPNERREPDLPTVGQQQAIRRMFAGMGRLTSLIESLVEHTLLHDGGLASDIELCSAGAIAASVLDELRPSADAKGLGLGLREVGALSPLRRDPALVRLVLLELVENAIQSTDRGLVEVVVECDPCAHRLAVIDSGPGIPAGTRDEIFEPFARTPRGDRRSFGLGLTLVREATSALGGQVEVESEEGSGSAFTVTLPRMAHELLEQGVAVH